MWKCLPFAKSTEEEEMERSRMAVIAAHALLNKLEVDSEVYKQPVSRGEIKVSGTASDDQRILTLAKIGPWKYNGGVTLWFGLFLASLGQVLFEYFTGVVDKMEKLEYY